MPEATMDEKETTSGSLRIRKYTIPSVNASTTSAEYSLEIMKEGKILAIRIACNSTDYDLSIRNKTGVTPPTTKEIYNYTEINQALNDEPLAIYYSNDDTTEVDKLYVKIKNDDDSNATGLISLEIILERI